MASRFSGESPQAMLPDLFGPSGRWPMGPDGPPSLTPENVAERFAAALARAGHTAKA